MLMREGARPGTPLGMSQTEDSPPCYPSEAQMTYDPVHHDGLTGKQWLEQERRTRPYRPKRKFFRNAGARTLAYCGLRPLIDSDPPSDYHESIKASRVRKVQKGIAIAALIAAPLIINKAAAYAMWSDSHPQFNQVVEGTNPDENCVMFQATGFGTRNSDETARLIAPTTSAYGDVYSLQYDNANFSLGPNRDATVNTSAITDVAEEIIVDNDYPCVSGFGSSFGGLVISDVMGQLAERLPDVRQDYVMLDGMPVGAGAVFDEELQKGTFLMTALTNPWVSWANGVLTRGVIEFAQRYDSMYRCKDGDLLGDCHVSMEGILWAIKETEKRMSPSAASNSLLGAQFRSIVVADFETSISNVADRPRVNRPVIVYFRPADPTRDHTVRTELSQAEIGNLTKKYGLEYVVVMLPPPAGHANPGDATSAYIEGIDEVFKNTAPPQTTHLFSPIISHALAEKTQDFPPRIITIPEQPTS